MRVSQIWFTLVTHKAQDLQDGTAAGTGVGLTPSLGGGAGPRAPVLWPDQLDM